MDLFQPLSFVFIPPVPSYHFFVYIFFFSSRRRHTRFKCDWSSDVCSSDLLDLEYAVVAAVGDEDRAGGVDRDAVRLGQFRLLGRAVQSRTSLLAGARDEFDLAVLRQVFADQMILGVGDEHVAVAIDAQVLGAVERRVLGRAAVAGRALFAGAGDGPNLAAGIVDPQHVAGA